MKKRLQELVNAVTAFTLSGLYADRQKMLDIYNKLLADYNYRPIENFSQWAKEERKRQGLTQTALGARMDVTSAWVSILETSAEPAGLATMKRWADALGYDVEVSFKVVKHE